MAVLRAIQFAAATVTGPGTTNLYTVPTGKKALLKWMSVTNYTGSTEIFQLRLNTANVVYAIGIGPYPNNVDTRTWIIFEPGDVIQGHFDASGTQAFVTLSGSLLTI